jgi:HEPN domain-containing protein
MAPLDEARQLLAAADKDWRALHGMDDADVFADEIFGFHAQQAAEKAFKAWLALLGVEYPKTHDLSLLLGILQSHG